MSNLNTETDIQDYNDIPVYFCKQCLSLKVRDAGLPDLLYCDECGASNIQSTHIEEWEKIYKTKYGLNYLDR